MSPGRDLAPRESSDTGAGLGTKKHELTYMENHSVLSVYSNQ